MASGTTDTCMSLLGADQKGVPEAERSMKRGKRERKKLNKKIERERESHTLSLRTGPTASSKSIIDESNKHWPTLNAKLSGKNSFIQLLRTNFIEMIAKRLKQTTRNLNLFKTAGNLKMKRLKSQLLEKGKQQKSQRDLNARAIFVSARRRK